MIGSDLIKAERAIYYMAIDILHQEEIPEDMWALVIDSAAGHVKDTSLTAIAMQELDWRQKAVESKMEAENARDDRGENGDGDQG